jgi:hypothetical protein
MLADVVGNVIVVASVPARVRELETVRVLALATPVPPLAGGHGLAVQTEAPPPPGMIVCPWATSATAPARATAMKTAAETARARVRVDLMKGIIG